MANLDGRPIASDGVRVDRAQAHAVERWRARAPPRLRLICIAHAGAGAAVFQPWPAALPATMELCALRLPGRERLIGLAPFRRMEPLVHWAADALAPWLDVPVVVFGHSLGALIAFELAREWRRRGDAAPRGLLVSGHRAPQLPRRQPAVADWPEEPFIAHVQALSGTPPDAFAHAELRQLIVPTLRADFAVLESYVHTAEAPLDLPLRAYGGADDPLVSAADLEPWTVHTRAAFASRVFPGHHFYWLVQRDALLRDIADALTILGA